MSLFALDQLDAPTFDNLGAAQGQEEAVRLLRQIAAGEIRPGAYLWGDEGFGKSHLLAAAADLAGRNGLSIIRLGEANRPAAGTSSGGSLLLVDDVEELGEAGQAELLSLLAESIDGEQAAAVVAGAVPARMLSLRADVRTRIEQLQPVRLGRLADAELERALVVYARRLGRVVDARVTQLLVHNCPRNMVTLVKALRAVDRFALDSNRKFSVGTVRSWLANRSQLF